MKKQLNICGHDYKLFFKDMKKEEADDNSGYCVVSGNKIVINKELPLSQQESTIIHETIEAINFLFELNLEHNKIMTLETALYQFLKDNYKINLIK